MLLYFVMMYQVLFKFMLLDYQTFADIKSWLEYVREERGSDVLGVLIANKIDIEERLSID